MKTSIRLFALTLFAAGSFAAVANMPVQKESGSSYANKPVPYDHRTPYIASVPVRRWSNQEVNVPVRRWSNQEVNVPVRRWSNQEANNVS